MIIVIADERRFALVSTVSIVDTTLPMEEPNQSTQTLTIYDIIDRYPLSADFLDNGVLSSFKDHRVFICGFDAEVSRIM